MDLETGFWDSGKREQRHGTPYKTEQRYSHIEWDEHYYTENTFLTLSRVLREIIWMLDQIHYENKYVPIGKAHGLDEAFRWAFDKWTFPDDYIELPDDLKKFRENPSALEQ